MKAVKRYFQGERRRHPRHPVRTDVEFYVWDTVSRRARTEKASGCLSDVSLKGACLQTDQLQIGGHHLLLDHDPGGRTVLVVEVPSSPGEPPWKVRAKVLSYDRDPGHRRYPFDVRLQFANPSAEEIKNLERLIKSENSPRKGEPAP